MTDRTFDKTKIAEKRKILNDVATKLKGEFFGLDEIIDKVIKSIHAWYIFPELITRPVIINLWGMTGVGKTQLVRRLVSLLDQQEKFVEIQMDGGSMKSNYDSSSICTLLSQSSINEGSPGILLLDEIQRFKTVDETGADVKLERFQDVWTLLSDGKFSADASMFKEIEMMIAMQDYQKDWVSIQEPKEEGEVQKPMKIRKFKLYPYEAKSLKKTLRLSESVQEIMQWDSSKIEEELNSLKANRTTWEVDYSKLVIFISGNLDTAFLGSRSTDDCDTDADFYHEETKKISSMHIKANLRQRFRPEQISRLGNNHIIYPSMSKKSYQQLILTTVQKYLTEMTQVSKIEFSVGNDILEEIYNNSVFPTQGTRPVFSSIHMIFSSLLSNVTFWAVENDCDAVLLKMTDDKRGIIVNSQGTRAKSEIFPVELEMNEKKAKATLDFKTAVAVHEAGHALLFSLLRKAAPKEVKINLASYNGGYMLPSEVNMASTREQIRNEITIFLAGTVAEEVVFGTDHRSTGAMNDIVHATQHASNYVRVWGFDGYSGYVNSNSSNSVHWITDLEATNPALENLLKEQREKAKTLISQNLKFFNVIVTELIEHNSITQDRFIKMAEKEGLKLSVSQRDHSYHQRWLEHLNKR